MLSEGDAPGNIATAAPGEQRSEAAVCAQGVQRLDRHVRPPLEDRGLAGRGPADRPAPVLLLPALETVEKGRDRLVGERRPARVVRGWRDLERRVRVALVGN